MFWRLFIFRGNSTREPASVVCNDEQGDLLHSAGPHTNRCWPQLTGEKLGRGFGKNVGEWTESKGLFAVYDSDTPVTLKHGQDNQTWYGLVGPKQVTVMQRLKPTLEQCREKKP